MTNFFSLAKYVIYLKPKKYLIKYDTLYGYEYMTRKGILTTN